MIIFEETVLLALASFLVNIAGTDYLGQVGTVVGWAEEQTPEGNIISSCRPRKLGLPVLGPKECLRSVVDPQLLTVDKGCVGVVGGPSYICSVSHHLI